MGIYEKRFGKENRILYVYIDRYGSIHKIHIFIIAIFYYLEYYKKQTFVK